MYIWEVETARDAPRKNKATGFGGVGDGSDKERPKVREVLFTLAAFLCQGFQVGSTLKRACAVSGAL